MKVYKKTSILSVSLAILTLLALCLVIVPTVAIAETSNSEFVLRKDSANNFIYSAEFTDLADTNKAGLVFGVSDDQASYWAVSANVADGKVELFKNDAVFKSARYSFEAEGLRLPL